MQLPPINPQYEPKFNPGDTVWVIQGNTIHRGVHKDKVSAVKLELIFTGQKKSPILACTGYRVSVTNFDTHDDSYPPYEVYGTKEEAEKLAKWHPVEKVSAEEWRTAIGNREDEETLEICELSRCCANVSNMRDILLDCQEYQGLMERDRAILTELVKGHDYPKPNGKRPEKLDKILGQLGIVVP